ncbi:hypothetical protein BD414DRAFT_87807 [Trametes punicea]|nr:hypothetical protein BD414DRAFT_87807 [Trametes punicea]
MCSSPPARSRTLSVLPELSSLGQRVCVHVSEPLAPRLKGTELDMKSFSRLFPLLMVASPLWMHVFFFRVSAEVVPYLEQGFLFDWTGDQSPPPLMAMISSR